MADRRTPTIDLAKLTPRQLKELKEQAEQRLEESHIERCKALKERFIQICEEEGVTLSDVWFEGKPGGGKAEVRYRDPSTSKTWSGRGKKPHWLIGNEKEFAV